MGYYIETLNNTNKARQIVNMFEGKIVTFDEARNIVKDKDSDMAVIVVIQNGFFDAAGYAFDEIEFNDLTLPNDHREKDFVVIKKEIAIKETGYTK